MKIDPLTTGLDFSWKQQKWLNNLQEILSSLGWDGTILTVTGGLTVTGAFTSLGIDDNATATSLTITVNQSVQPVSFRPPTATSAALNAIGNAINTGAAKVQGTMVYNTTTDNPVYAVGNTDGAVWVDGAGTTVNTPVA